MVLEPDDPDRRALHDVDVAVSIKVDGVHRRRALAMDAGGQQRRRERHDAAASHSRAFCDAWPWRVVCGGARVAWPPGSNRFHQYCELRGDGSRTFSDRGARAIEAPPRARRASRRRGLGTMLDCVSRQGQPNGSLFHGLGPRGSACRKKPRGWGRARGPGCPRRETARRGIIVTY